MSSTARLVEAARFMEASHLNRLSFAIKDHLSKHGTSKEHCLINVSPATVVAVEAHYFRGEDQLCKVKMSTVPLKSYKPGIKPLPALFYNLHLPINNLYQIHPGSQVRHNCILLTN